MVAALHDFEIGVYEEIETLERTKASQETDGRLGGRGVGKRIAIEGNSVRQEPDVFLGEVESLGHCGTEVSTGSDAAVETGDVGGEEVHGLGPVLVEEGVEKGVLALQKTIDGNVQLPFYDPTKSREKDGGEEDDVGLFVFAKPIDDFLHLLYERAILALEGGQGDLTEILAGSHAAAGGRLAEEPLGVESTIDPLGSVPKERELVLEVNVYAPEEDGLIVRNGFLVEKVR
jgi:hypothetical protein